MPFSTAITLNLTSEAAGAIPGSIDLPDDYRQELLRLLGLLKKARGDAARVKAICAEIALLGAYNDLGEFDSILPDFTVIDGGRPWSAQLDAALVGGHYQNVWHLMPDDGSLMPGISALRTAGEAMFGSRWQSELASHLRINSRQVRQWLAGDRPIPVDLWPRVRQLALARAALASNIAKMLGNTRYPNQL
jgi:hypothetical protein